MLGFSPIKLWTEVEGLCLLTLLSSTPFWSGPKAVGFFMIRKVDSPLVRCLAFGDSEMATQVVFGSRLLLSLTEVGANQMGSLCTRTMALVGPSTEPWAFALEVNLRSGPLIQKAKQSKSSCSCLSVRLHRPVL